MSNQTISLTLEERTVTGKAVRKLRKEGFVPAVVYQGGKESQSVQAEYGAIAKTYAQAGRNTPVNLKVGTKSHLAMIKAVDFDPVKHRIRHIAFHAINKNETVTAEVPVKMRLEEGNDSTPAERAGLVVLTTLDSVEVEAKPNDLPNVLEFDGEKLLEVGDHITIADLVVPSGVEIKAEGTLTVASVYEPSALAAANDAAGGDAEDESEVEAENGEEVAPEGEASEAGDKKPAEAKE